MTSPSVIEIIGSAGIGKSTLSQSLIRRAIPGRQGQLLSVAQVLSVPRLKRPEIVRKLFQRYKLASKNPVPSRFLFRRCSLNDIFRGSHSEEWTRFISICLDIATEDYRSSEERLLGISFLYNTIASRLFIDYWVDGEQIILMDEPLGYRPSMFNSLAPVPSPTMEKYYKAVPLPDAIIHLTASIDTVVERVSNRKSSGRAAHRHNGLSVPEIRKDTEWASHLANYGVQVMRERGVPVLDVCAEDDMSGNLDKSLEFINKLQGARNGP